MGTTGSGLDMLRFAGSVAIVLLLLGAMMWMLRRMKSVQQAQGGARRLQLLETISLGPSQKIALLRVGGQQVLVGITASQFAALGTWPDSDLPVELPHAK